MHNMPIYNIIICVRGWRGQLGGGVMEGIEGGGGDRGGIEGLEGDGWDGWGDGGYRGGIEGLEGVIEGIEAGMEG